MSKSVSARVLAPLVAVPIALAGCSSSTGSPRKSADSTPPASTGSSDTGGGTEAVTGAITVYAAASLTEAFGTIKTQFEKLYPGTTVTLQFGASSDLATRISQGAPVDVFASASTKNMMQLGAAAVDAKDFVANTAEIAVPPSNPGKIAMLADLARKGVKVAECAAAVPCGVVADKVFANAKITVAPVARPADVKSTLALVESGEVDAGLVYVSDVRSAGAKVKGIPIPADVNASTTYPIARLKDAKNSAVAEAFTQYVLGAEGQKVLLADGFVAP